jgi:hypothetical protein
LKWRRQTSDNVMGLLQRELRQNRWMIMMMQNKLLPLVGMVIMAGCAGRPAIVPSSDPALRKTSTQLAADAAKRSYEAEAPRGGEAVGRAEVDYGLKELHIVNLSSEDWRDVEVWVNQHWVVYLPVLPHQQSKVEGFRRINFPMFYDRDGNFFPVNFINSKVRIEKVEVFHDGKMYDVPLRLADD